MLVCCFNCSGGTKFWIIFGIILQGKEREQETDARECRKRTDDQTFGDAERSSYQECKRPML